MKTKLTLIVIVILFVGTSGILIKTINKKKELSNYHLKNTVTEKGEISFNLQKPDKKIKLPLELQEISALSYHKNEQLACLHDEKADFFLVNYLTENIDQKFAMAGKGDFEGIEIVDNTAYMLKSNGLLIKIVDFTKKSRIITKHKTGLSKKNDCEGLGFDPLSGKLLIACKVDPKLPGSFKKYKGKRAVYEFDINTQKLNKKPRFLISLKEIAKKTGKKKFMPSGIAVHPITHNIYITATVGKLLIVLNRDGELIDFAHLDPKVFRQPEGICFSADGKKLFISNEGRNKKGNILVFN